VVGFAFVLLLAAVLPAPAATLYRWPPSNGPILAALAGIGLALGSLAVAFSALSLRKAETRKFAARLFPFTISVVSVLVIAFYICSWVGFERFKHERHRRYGKCYRKP
jgi:heme/copper-type cytochrome/quinol oxidase subunit 3